MNEKKVEKIATEMLMWAGAIVVVIVLIGSLRILFNNDCGNSRYDSTALETWASNGQVGTVRMVGAWPIAEDEGTWVLEDEEGYLWRVHDEAITKHDSLLLWIDDSDTERVNDDVIVRMWREVY